MFRSLPAVIEKHPLIILAFSILLTVFLSFGIANLKMRPFFEGDLPPNDPILLANERYSSYFGKDEFVYLALVNDTIYRASTLKKIVAITEELNSLDHVLEEETLSLATVRKVKWREWGLDVRKYFSPLPQTPDEVERLREDIRLDSEIFGRLVSEDETATLFAARLSPGYDQRELYLSLHRIAKRYCGPEGIYPFGHQIMSEEANLGMRHDARLLGPAALLLMAIGIFIFFRSVRLTIGPVLMILMSIVWTMGIMYYIGFRLSVLSPCIPAVLIALGSSYMIHVIYSCSIEAAGSGEANPVMEGVRKISRPIALAAFTSMVGFATLVVFRILSIREFGVCVALGVGCAAFLSLVLLPAIMVLQRGGFGTSPPKSFRSFDAFLDRVAHIGLRCKYAVVGIGVVLVIFSATGIARINVGSAPEKIFPRNHRAREVVSLFINKFHGPYTLNVMFTAQEPDGLKSPEVLKHIDAFQEFAKRQPKVKDVMSIVNILKRMNRILNEDDPDFYKVPESKEMVAQSLLIYSLTQDPVQFETLMDFDIQRCKVVITTTIIDTEELEDLRQTLAAYCTKTMKDGVAVDFGGRSLVWLVQNRYIVVGKLITIVANAVLIWAICAVAFRSGRLGLISIMPLSLATLATFGLMGHMGIRLDMTTAVLTGISVGVGVDFAIHFISRLKRQALIAGQLDEAVRTTMIGAGRAIIFDVISNILGFMAFLFSGFAPVRILGVLVCFTMVSCVILTLIFIPAAVALIRVPFRYPGKETVFLADGRTEKEEAL